jgi:hypothetical protein
MKYQPAIVLAWFAQNEIPSPLLEHKFALPRKWRFDFAWPAHKVALEVQGGIWNGGRHSRGASLLKEWEKLNQAAIQGWRILYCQPKDLCTTAMIETLEAALNV